MEARNNHRLVKFVLLSLTSLLLLEGNLNGCLKMNGCHRDECCLWIIPKTGPVCVQRTYCSQNFKLLCCENIVPVETDYGTFYGYKVLLDEMDGYHNDGQRYLEIWRGIPYVRPATRENGRRFRRAHPLEQSNVRYDATRPGPVCSKHSLTNDDWPNSERGWLERLFPEAINISQSSEDCLHLSIYSLRDRRKYSTTMDTIKRLPILMIFSGHDDGFMNSNLYPGHILAQLDMMVITVNYRSGVFGFISKSNDLLNELPSLVNDEKDFMTENLGLWDQLEAIQFVRKIAHKFNGDPDQITLLGQGISGNHLIYHLFSRLSLNQDFPLAQRMILVDPKLEPSDLSFNREARSLENFAFIKKMAQLLGCEMMSSQLLFDCLRSRGHLELSQAAQEVSLSKPENLFTCRPFRVVVDGELLEDIPENMYNADSYSRIPVITMLSKEAGCFSAISWLARILGPANIINMKPVDFVKTLQESIDLSIILKALMKMAKGESARDSKQVAKLINLEYKSARYSDLQRFIDIFTDQLYATGTFRFLEMISTNRGNPLASNHTQLLIHAYKPRLDLLSRYLKTYYGSVMNNILGLYYYLADQRNINWEEDLRLVKPSYYHLEEFVDKNITDYFMWMVSNIVHNGNATPYPIRNMTWDTFRPDNRTYFYVNLDKTFKKSLSFQRFYTDNQSDFGYGFDLRQNYRTTYLNFWEKIYPNLLRLEPRRPFYQLTPSFLNTYRLASFILGGMICFFIILVYIIYFSLRRRRRSY